MPSEVGYAIANRLDSASQCLQIMQDHKNMDFALKPRGLKEKLASLKKVCFHFRDKLTLMLEDL